MIISYNELVAVLGLDLGEKRVGVALATAPAYVAVPQGALPAIPREQLIIKLKKLVKEWGVSHLVLGLPLETSGREGKSAQQVRKLGGMLSSILGLPLTYVDERFTTCEAEKLGAVSGKATRKREGWKDAIAASLVLDTYIKMNLIRYDDK